MSTEKKCEQRIDEHLQDRIADLRKLLDADRRGEADPELGYFNEYGLSFDYVSKGTFSDQKEGYFRYQLSWGGPSDEFRFYTDAQLNLSRIEYVFMDWYDGATRELTGSDNALLEEIFEDFKETGMLEAALKKAEE